MVPFLKKHLPLPPPTRRVAEVVLLLSTTKHLSPPPPLMVEGAVAVRRPPESERGLECLWSPPMAATHLPLPFCCSCCGGCGGQCVAADEQKGPTPTRIRPVTFSRDAAASGAAAAVLTFLLLGKKSVFYVFARRRCSVKYGWMIRCFAIHVACVANTHAHAREANISILSVNSFIRRRR